MKAAGDHPLTGGTREMIAGIAELLSRLPDTEGCRPIDADAVARLESVGCSSCDWSRVTVSESCSLDGVESSRFEGCCHLDLAPGARISGCTLEGCRLHGRVRVERTGLVSSCILLDGSVVEDCGRIDGTDPRAAFGGPLLDLGVETGERRLQGSPWISFRLACVMTEGEVPPDLAASYSDALRTVASTAGDLPGCIVGEGAVVRCARLVTCTHLGQDCLVENPGVLRRSILLGGPGRGSRVTDGAMVRSCILKPGASVSDGALAENSLLFEDSVLEHGGILTASILGPGSVQGGGEVVASLVGPLCSMHHQSLLIAARWPDGCGNLGYGANAGSNHTSRLPDQEMRLGAGVFIGLGSSLKFPLDLSAAPGTVVATGMVLPPQRIEYPLSLLAKPEQGGGAVLVPGWLVHSNLFALLRNELKYRERWPVGMRDPVPGILRPGIYELIERAGRRLEEATPGGGRGSVSVEGAGTCVITAEAAARGAEAYSFLLDWLCARLLTGIGAFPAIPDDYLYERARRVYGGLDRQELAARHSELGRRAVELLESSRTRDFERGSSIIADYARRHEPPSSDPVLGKLIQLIMP